MRIAIMQPYFLPYVGYFQLINAVDKFVVYDNIEYTKKGWINRNRMLVNGNDEFFSLPIKKDSDFLDVRQRYLADTISNDKDKILRKVKESYRKAPFFNDGIGLISDIFSCPEMNLFEFVRNSIQKTCCYLDIQTELVISSKIRIDHSLKAERKVFAICKAMNATDYINPIGGVELYSNKKFLENGIKLNFLKSKPIVYKQYNNEFISWLSIIDVIMFNSKEQVKNYLNEGFDLISNS